MTKQTDIIIKTVPAAAELRKVPGFDPLRYLRRTTSKKSGEPVLKLDLPYKKLWFRLACPNSRTLLKPLRITDQMAIFEAQLFLDRSDPEPIANFTSTMMARDVPGGRYIQAAQDEALNEVLDSAGFGIQLADLVEASGGSGYGSEIPLAQVEAAVGGVKQPAPVEQVETPAPAAVPEMPGNRIKVSKRNMIIPHVEENLDRGGFSLEAMIPHACPCCGQPTRIHTSPVGTKVLFCDNPNCETRHLRKFVHFVGKKAMDIDGLSEATLEKLIGRGWLHSYMDLYIGRGS